MSQSDINAQMLQALQDLQGSDAQVARVTEDLISLLVARNVILFTDLPEVVQKKLIHREQLRERVRRPVVSIVSEDDTL